MKNAIILLLLIGIAAEATSQVELKRAYKPASESQAPATYSTGNTVAPPQTIPTTANPDMRRAAAVAKVQGTQNTTTAKGLRPAEYSTGGDLSPVMYSTPPDPATTVTVNGINVQRNVRKGSGQVGNDLFTPVSQLHFVQFAVYCKDTPVDKAPAIDGLYLLWHPGSICPGGERGASYIVKGYTTPEEAKAAVTAYKASRIDCWYNPALTGAEVEIIGVR